MGFFFWERGYHIVGALKFHFRLLRGSNFMVNLGNLESLL